VGSEVDGRNKLLQMHKFQFEGNEREQNGEGLIPKGNIYRIDIYHECKRGLLLHIHPYPHK
jgi:hypothetical protein